jgi:quinohemoprotein ethanol dehydrogenase
MEPTPGASCSRWTLAPESNSGNGIDPVTQKERWGVKYNTTFNGGTMTTAGNLVFQGSADGRFAAFSADKGEKLWEVQFAPGAATPITYELDGKQYVSVMSGRGAPVLRPGQAANEAGKANTAPSRMYTFVLDGKAPVGKQITSP